MADRRNESHAPLRTGQSIQPGYTLSLIHISLGLDSVDSNLFTLSLSLPLQEDARQLIQHFRADPQAFLRALKAL